mgnify:FL=1
MNLNDIIKSLDDITRLLQTIAQDLDQDDFTTADQMHTAATNTTAMELIAECIMHLKITKNTRRQPYE